MADSPTSSSFNSSAFTMYPATLAWYALQRYTAQYESFANDARDARAAREAREARNNHQDSTDSSMFSFNFSLDLSLGNGAQTPSPKSRNDDKTHEGAHARTSHLSSTKATPEKTVNKVPASEHKMRSQNSIDIAAKTADLLGADMLATIPLPDDTDAPQQENKPATTTSTTEHKTNETKRKVTFVLPTLSRSTTTAPTPADGLIEDPTEQTLSRTAQRVQADIRRAKQTQREQAMARSVISPRGRDAGDAEEKKSTGGLISKAMSDKVAMTESGVTDKGKMEESASSDEATLSALMAVTDKVQGDAKSVSKQSLAILDKADAHAHVGEEEDWEMVSNDETGSVVTVVAERNNTSRAAATNTINTSTSPSSAQTSGSKDIMIESCIQLPQLNKAAAVDATLAHTEAEPKRPAQLVLHRTIRSPPDQQTLVKQEGLNIKAREVLTLFEILGVKDRMMEEEGMEMVWCEGEHM